MSHCIDAVSTQWASRPDDERFTSLKELYDATIRARDCSREALISPDAIRIERQAGVDKDQADVALRLVLPTGEAVAPSHWAFGQLCSMVQAPAYYLRKLPAKMAAINLQYALSATRTQPVKAYVQKDIGLLRALTGPDYGRVYDCDVAATVSRMVEHSIAEWKVPGAFNSDTGAHDPDVPVTKKNTTLYASDRDMFIFLCADRVPIEVGRLDNGDPDLVFRGFYVSNSEVGSRQFCLATMYFRAVCGNRLLWGVENFHELSFKHTRKAPERFLRDAGPLLRSYVAGDAKALKAGVIAAKAATVAKTDEERVAFLRKRGFTASDTDAIIASVLGEEHHPAESVWDFCQGITRVAQDKPNADARFDMEKAAGKLLDAI